jgi:eukaryotic-like serine/threonine-protein kinase
MAFPPTRASGPFRPTRLGQWEVVAKIAGGGMSAVYLGRRVDPEPDVPNVVALKIVRHDVAKDDQLVRMFLEEGKLLARLVHPNIVRTLEVGGDAEQDFIAMELMLGKPFAAIHDALVARKVRLNAEIAAWTAARIADALHYAHELTDEHGRSLALVHRDVNPANVFATFKGEVKLFDFGLAKVTAGEASGSQLLAGKLSYLSPEQIMQMPLDRRSDIFSLGTTLWELLTSRRLFRRDSDAETVRAVQLGPIPDPRTVAPEIPEELARIARTALERNRDHRYPSAAHLARELDAFVLARTSSSDVASRLAQLVDTLFPGEQKRQSGWLKPAITSSISRPPSHHRPTPPAIHRDTRETTVVMSNAPPTARSRDSSQIPATRDVAMTARDGVPAVDTHAMTVPEGVLAIPPGSVPPASLPPSPPPSVPTRTPWPSSRTPAGAPPLPRGRSTRGPVPTPPILKEARPAPPRPPVPPALPRERESTPSAKPGPSPVGLGTAPRPKRPPVPLPSRARVDSVPPKAIAASPRVSAEAPPDSEPTQVDMPVSPDRARR